MLFDQAKDVSNEEQVLVVLWRVSSNLTVSEECLVLHHVLSTDVPTLTTVARNAMQSLGLPLAKLWGQCYDGTSCKKSCVLQRIKEEGPRAVYRHCYRQTLKILLPVMQ